MSGLPGGDAAVTAAAMRAGACLVERAGIGGLSVSCCRGRIVIQPGQSDGDGPGRARIVAAVAALLGCVPAQRDSRISADAWLEAAGQVSGIPVEVYTALAVRPAPGGAGSLAAGPAGRVAVIGAGQQLPPGWRWVTELDDEHAAAAAIPLPVA